jgi:DNA-binding transcriptional LysR family regulator
MLDQLRSLAVFAKVADLGSFRAAARALGLSPSVVSHHVRELEARLALPLIHRSTRRLALTPDGEVLVGAAREMAEAAERGLGAVTGRGGVISGTLRVTAPAFLTTTRFARDLAEFAREHPRVRLTLGFTDAPRDLLRDGLDVALRVGRLPESNHKVKKLADMRRVLVATPRYRDAHPLTAPAGLAELDVVHLSSRPPEFVLTSPDRRHTTVGFAPRVAVDSADAIRELVLAGVGVATLPEVTVRADLARGRLVELLPGWKAASIPAYAMWPNSAQRSALTARFVDFLAARVASLFSPE